jgi:hypothetical protein
MDEGFHAPASALGHLDLNPFTWSCHRCVPGCTVCRAVSTVAACQPLHPQSLAPCSDGLSVVLPRRRWNLWGPGGGRCRCRDCFCSRPTKENNTFTWSGPSGVLGCTGQRRIAPPARWCMPGTHYGRRLSRCAIEPAESPGGVNLRRGKRLRLRFWKGCRLQHTYPFALNHPLVASLQLCSHFVYGMPLGVRPSVRCGQVPRWGQTK